MNHDRLFHKGTGTVQSKKLYFVLSIVIVLGVTICFFWRVWHTSDRLVTIHGEIITSQAVDMYSQIDTIGRTDLKVIGFLDNNIISCYWIQNARTLSNAAQEEEFEELLVTADYKSGDTRLIRRTKWNREHYYDRSCHRYNGNAFKRCRCGNAIGWIC